MYTNPTRKRGSGSMCSALPIQICTGLRNLFEKCLEGPACDVRSPRLRVGLVYASLTLGITTYYGPDTVVSTTAVAAVDCRRLLTSTFTC